MKTRLLFATIVLILASLALDAAENRQWSDWFELDGGQPLPAIRDEQTHLFLDLDNGRIASVLLAKIESQEPSHLPGDDYIVAVTAVDFPGATIPVWASYGRFAIAAADLVEGSGDELLIVSQQGRGSPLFAPVLQVWAFEKTGRRKLLQLEVGSFVSPCALWRDQVRVVGKTKPRSLHLVRQVFSESCPETPEVSAARSVAERELRFSVRDGRFELVQGGQTSDAK
jgi:hypothetical protein